VIKKRVLGKKGQGMSSIGMVGEVIENKAYGA